jgi:MFS family permease
LLAQLGLDLSSLTWPALIGIAALLLGLWLGGRWADHHAPRPVLLLGLAALTLCFALAAAPGLAGRLPLVGLLAGAAYGSFLAGWNGLVAQVQTQTLAPQDRAAAWGAVMSTESLGYALAPLLGSLLWVNLGQPGLFGAGALVWALVLGFHLWRSAGRSRANAAG